MAAKKSSKKTVQPNYTGSLADYKESLNLATSKKEQLFGQELGKIGRAAERGGPVNTVQKEHGEHSVEVMYANKMKNMPFKKKLEGISDAVIASSVTSPIGFRTPNIVNKLITSQSSKIGTNLGEEVLSTRLAEIEQAPINAGNKIKGMRGTVVTPAGVSEGASSYRVTPVRTEAQILGDINRRITVAEKEASKIASYSAQGAKQGLVRGAIAGGVAGAGATAAVAAAISKKKGSGSQSKKR